jgi:hypothetical protein
MKTKSDYICDNCDTKQNRSYIDAMRRAGHGLQHLACCECGRHGIAEYEFEPRRRDMVRDCDTYIDA